MTGGRLGGREVPFGPRASTNSTFSRKEKRMLTFIPEKSKCIEFRFTFVLVGTKSKKIAELVCNSEIAANYVPTAHQHIRESLSGFSNQMQLPGQNSSEEMNVGSTRSPTGSPTGSPQGSLAHSELQEMVNNLNDKGIRHNTGSTLSNKTRDSDKSDNPGSGVPGGSGSRNSFGAQGSGGDFGTAKSVPLGSSFGQEKSEGLLSANSLGRRSMGGDFGQEGSTSSVDSHRSTRMRGSVGDFGQGDMRCFCPLGPKVAAMTSNAAVGSSTIARVDTNEGLPTAEAASAERLCRIVFRSVEKFSDSLPPIQDEVTGRNTAFVFVVDFGPEKCLDADAWDEVLDVAAQLRDLEMRTFEHKRINQGWRPPKFCLKVNQSKSTEEDRARVEEWQKKHHLTEKKVHEVQLLDDGELFEVCQILCEKLAINIEGGQQDGPGESDKRKSNSSLFSHDEMMTSPPEKEQSVKCGCCSWPLRRKR